MTTTQLPPTADRPISARLPTPDERLQAARERYIALYGPATTPPSWIVRLVEMVIAATALVLVSPLMVVLVCLIKATSPGPAVFKQARIRQGMTSFAFYKFRSMIVDSDTRFPELVQFERKPDELSEFRFKVENDPRITRIGSWLRRTSLDELPNLWNLLTGDVALVGPRPEIAAMLANYDDAMLKKFTIRPGITGLAQICGRGDLTFLETIRYDLEYIETRSLWLDLKILFLTFFSCLTGRGAK